MCSGVAARTRARLLGKRGYGARRHCGQERCGRGWCVRCAGVSDRKARRGCAMLHPRLGVQQDVHALRPSGLDRRMPPLARQALLVRLGKPVFGLRVLAKGTSQQQGSAADECVKPAPNPTSRSPTHRPRGTGSQGDRRTPAASRGGDAARPGGGPRSLRAPRLRGRHGGGDSAGRRREPGHDLPELRDQGAHRPLGRLRRRPARADRAGTPLADAARGRARRARRRDRRRLRRGPRTDPATHTAPARPRGDRRSRPRGSGRLRGPPRRRVRGASRVRRRARARRVAAHAIAGALEAAVVAWARSSGKLRLSHWLRRAFAALALGPWPPSTSPDRNSLAHGSSRAVA